ncbi:MAG: sugar transferase, partial [Actinomycetota bacterium]
MSDIPADAIDRTAKPRVVDLTSNTLTVVPAESGTRRRVRRERFALVSGIAVTDALALLLGLGLATLITPPFAAGSLVAAYLLAPVVSVIVFGAFRLYSTQHMAPNEEFRRVILASAVSVLVLLAISSWTAPPLVGLGIVVAWSSSLVVTLVGRKFWRWLVARARSGGRLVSRTLVVGTNLEVERLAKEMRDPEWGYRFVGCVSTSQDLMASIGLADTNGHGNGHGNGHLNGHSNGNGHVSDLPVVGHIGGIEEIIRETGAECVFVASSAVNQQEMIHVARAARRMSTQLCVSSNMTDTLASRLSPHPVGNVMALAVRPVRLSGPQALLKRTFDLVSASAALILLSPLLALIALAIRIESRGPVIFRQLRAGRGGKPFEVLKFRTMVQGAEAMMDSLKERNEVDGPIFKMRRDPRITRVGKWLRRFSLDEVPQLVNVVRGEMSLVGPRPLPVEQVVDFQDWHQGRFEVPPGITGLWQVNGRSDVSFDEFIRLDLF